MGVWKQTNSSQPCDICGDAGFVCFLATCTNCQRSREHIYCMHPNLCSVPATWYCEVCRPCKVVSEKFDLKDFHTLASSPNTFEKVSQKNKHSSSSIFSTMGHHDTLHSGDPRSPGEEVQASSKKQKMMDTGNGSSTKVPDASQSMVPPKLAVRQVQKTYIPKDVETGKVKYLRVEDVYALSCGGKTKASPAKDGCKSQTMRTSALSASTAPSSSHQKANAYMSSPRHSRPLMLGKTHLEQQMSKPSHESHGPKSPLHVPLKLSTPESSKVQKMVQEITSRKSDMSSSKVLSLKRAKRSDGEVCNQIGSGVSNGTERSGSQQLQGSNKISGKEVSLVFNDDVHKEDPVDAFVHTDEDYSKFGEEDLPNPPALKAAWKGSFEIFDPPAGFYDGFQGHHPGRISRKAYNFSKGMPGILRFMLRPRCNVWPAIFRKGPPTGYDIALYFFPGDFCRSQQQYSSLQALIDKDDLSLYICMGSVELLIFTSRQLPVASRKINQCFYLWGVFRSSKQQISSVSLQEEQWIISVPSLEYRTGGDSENVMHDAESDDMVCEEDVRKVDKVMGEGDAELVDREIYMMGGKNVGKVDKVVSLNVSHHPYEGADGSNSEVAHNSKDERNSCSLDPSSKVYSDQPASKATGAQLSLEVKREQQDALDSPPGFRTLLTSPPGFSRPATGDAAQKEPVKQLHQKVPHVPRNLGFPPVFRGLLTEPPGFSRPVIGDDAQKGSVQKSLVKLPPMPPGFCKQFEGDKRDFSSKVVISEKTQLNPIATYQNIKFEKNRLDQHGSPLLANLKDMDGSSLEDGEFRYEDFEVPDDPKGKAKEWQHDNVNQTEQKKKGSLTPRTSGHEIRLDIVDELQPSPTSVNECHPRYPKEGQTKYQQIGSKEVKSEYQIGIDSKHFSIGESDSWNNLSRDRGLMPSRIRQWNNKQYRVRPISEQYSQRDDRMQDIKPRLPPKQQ